MQAVVLAAGMGRRLGAMTEDKTKCMVPLHGRTLIERSLDALVNAGVERIVLVVGYHAAGVMNLVGDTYQGVPVVYVHNPRFTTTNNVYSLYLARDYLVEQDTLLLESDVAFQEKILTDLLAHPAPNVAVVDHYKSWMDGTVVTLLEDGSIERFIPKKDFKGADVDKYYKTVNIYKLSADYLRSTYVPFLGAYVQTMGNNEYYEQVLRVVTTLERQDLVAMRLNGEKWYEIDDIQDYMNAETVLAPEDEMYDRYLGRHGGYWRFPQVLDFCYLVNPYFPPRDMLDEMKRQFDSLLSQYPSSATVNNHLAARMFGFDDDSQVIAGNGAAELIATLGIALAETPMVISTPTFEEYLERFDSHGVQAPSECGSVDAEAVAGAMAGASAVVLVNPDNPSGQCLSTQEVEALARHLESQGKRLILDESFIDFAEPSHCETFLTPERLAQFPSMVVVRSISKSYGVPGARLGVLASSDAVLLKELRRMLPVWNINSFGEFFLQTIRKYAGEYDEACLKIRAERDAFCDQLSKVEGLRVVPSHANYFLCEVVNGLSATELSKTLLREHDILVKDCSSKVGMSGEFIRVAVRDREDNTRFLRAVAKVLG